MHFYLLVAYLVCNWLSRLLLLLAVYGLSYLLKLNPIARISRIICYIYCLRLVINIKGNFMNTTTIRYTKTAIALHWLIGLAIIAMFFLGWYMADLPKDAPKVASFDFMDLGIYTVQLGEAASPRNFYFNLHKSIGVTLLALIALRIFWRITNQPPALLATMKEWERKLAKGGHHLLYLLMVIMPLSGLIMATYSKYGVKWFGVPFISGKDNPDIWHLFEGVHEVLGFIFITVIIVHIIAALKHQFIDKDETMKRMSLR